MSIEIPKPQNLYDKWKAEELKGIYAQINKSIEVYVTGIDWSGHTTDRKNRFCIDSYFTQRRKPFMQEVMREYIKNGYWFTTENNHTYINWERVNYD